MKHQKENKVALVYTSLVHYRKSLFELFLEENSYDFYLIVGKKDPVPNLKSFTIHNKKILIVKNAILRIRSSFLLYQFPLIIKTVSLKPNLVILFGVNPQYISSLILFFLLKVFTRTKVFWWGHGTLGHQGNIGEKIRLFFYSKSDGVLLYDQVNKEKLKRRLKNVPIKVVGNTLNHEDFGFNINPELLNEKLNKSKDTTNLIFSGRLTKRKKVKYLILALSKLNREGNNFKLTVVGEGNEKDEMIKLSKDLNEEKNVTFAGEKYGSELYELFMQADIYVLPAHAGLSLVHANSYGLPVITSENPFLHPPEFTYLKPGINGDVYEDDNIDSLVRKILYWTQRLKSNSKEISISCIQESKNYLPDQMKNRFDEMIFQAIGK